MGVGHSYSLMCLPISTLPKIEMLPEAPESLTKHQEGARLGETDRGCVGDQPQQAQRKLAR